jgi:PAS domain S-box-containing protein
VVVHRLLLEDGSIKWVEEKCDTQFDKDGIPLISIGTVQDITERKNIQDKLEYERAFFKTLINTISDLIWLKDKDGVYLYCNPRFETMYGHKEKDIVNKTDYDFTDKETADFFRKHDLNAMHNDKATVNEELITFADGHQELLLTTKIPMKTVEGELIGILGVGHDITEQRKTEDELKQLNYNLTAVIDAKTQDIKESEVFLSNIMESALDGIVTINEKGIIQTFNKAAENLFGYTKDEAIGRNVNILIPEPYHSQHNQYLENYITTGIKKAIGQTAELDAKRKDGSLFPASIRIGEIKFDDKRIFTALIQDITERKNVQNELIKAKEEAEAATKAKSGFLANMSHEIRTPMNGIIGMSHLALKTDLDDRQKNYISKINLSANTLLGIINDILDISKIEAGKLVLDKSNFDLFKTIENVINLIELKAEDKALEVIVNYDPQLGKEFYGDSLRINQILTNLLGNAVKFTSEGEVSLHVKKINDTKVQFEVHDTGIGLTNVQIHKLFQSFSQADLSTTKKYGGTGLGLSISKQLVELMNGKIWVESELGKGSQFIFEIELEKIKKEKAFNIFSDKKVLVVDDSQSWIDILSHLVKSFGMESYSARTGFEALDILRAKPEFYDLILIDWDMPEIDGIETCKIIENDLKIDISKVILVSAYSKEALLEGIKGTNIDYCLNKPVNPSALNDILSELFLGKSMQEVTPNISENDLQDKIKMLKGKNVLLVEDNEINQEIVLDVLTESGLNIDIANNGLEAIKMYQNNSSQYDLILMDIQMPVLDGYEVTKEIRTFTKELPIIALTANAMVEDIEKTKAAGMDAHLNKPIDMKKLFETLLEFIPVENNDELSSISNKKSNFDFSKLESLDTQYALDLVMGNEEIYTKLLKGVVKYKGMDFDSMDDEEFQRTFHSLKGILASVGSQELSDLALEIEKSLNRDLVQEFVINFNDVVEEIERVIDMD